MFAFRREQNITFSLCKQETDDRRLHYFYGLVLLAQMKRLFSKTQQRFSVFGTCFDVSNIIISHYEYM